MYKIAYVLLAALVLSCAGQNNKEGKQTEVSEESAMAAEHPDQDAMLLGLQDREALQQPPFNSWFDVNYGEYRPDAAMVEKLKPLTEGLEITMFMGTWCGDSKREVPAFFKLLDALEFPADKVTLITMDTDKTTPDNLEKDLEITNVPTIIFKKKGKELNRIVEYPIESLEADMLSILKGEDYKHAYAW
jgi:thiol-disulfide isomerase/thioredoxin